MKQIMRSVPAILVASAASLSMIALAGCGSSGGSNNPTGAKAAKSVYVVVNSNNNDVEQDSVAVFSAAATGSTAPTSTLTLPSGFYGSSVAIGSQGQIYVGGWLEDSDYGEILEYAAGASGSATPTLTLNGAENSFDFPDSLATNSAGTLFVAADNGSLEAFASGFTASSAPSQYLTWGQDNFYNWGDYLGADTAGDVFYVDTYGGESGDGAIYVFAAGATGATAPTRTITGTNTNSFDDIWTIAVDGAGDVYTVNYNESDDPNGNAGVLPGTYGANRRATGPHRASQLAAHSHLTAHPHEDLPYAPTEIIEFAAGATGNATPTKVIGGSATNIVEPLKLAVDAASNLYYADAQDWYSDTNTSVLLEVFSPSASGNVAPAASMTLTSFTYENSSAVAVQ